MAWARAMMVITLLPPLPGVKRSSRSLPASHWSDQAQAGLWLVETGPGAPLCLVVLYRAGKWEDSATLNIMNIHKDDGWPGNWCCYEGKLSQIIRTFLWHTITPMKTVQTYSISTANTIVTLNNRHGQHYTKIMYKYDIKRQYYVLYCITWTMEGTRVLSVVSGINTQTRLFDLTLST